MSHREFPRLTTGVLFAGRVWGWVAFGFSIAFSFLAGAWALYLKFFEGVSFVQTPLPLLVVLAFITGVMSILMGLIAEIIMRTYYESQGKQVYLVKDTVNVAGPN